MESNKVDRAKAAPNPAMSQWFAGDVLFQPIVSGSDPELLAVFFPASGRTHPHIHVDDQILYFVEGEGIVATEDQVIHTQAGDVVTVPAGIWHWHGASRDTAAVHISIKRPTATNWEVDEKDWANGYK